MVCLQSNSLLNWLPVFEDPTFIKASIIISSMGFEDFEIGKVYR